MRLGVLDVGSNTVHLLVVDARPGARPVPAYSHKTDLRLAEHLDSEGAISSAGAAALKGLVAEALEIGEDKGCQSVLAFATSAVREATNGDAVLSDVTAATGIDLSVLSGDQEARLTFLAVRRWFGWSSRRLLVFDIGGGSLELATGLDEDPDAAMSMLLGAGRLTRLWFTSDPPPADEVKALRRHIRAEIAKYAGQVLRFGAPDHVVGTSKTFRQLVRVCGAAPSSEGPYVKRTMQRSVLNQWLPKLAAMTSDERAELPGVSSGRAPQLLAGAMVAEAAMDLFEVAELEACPWALREGVILRHLDTMEPEDFT
jgi:exopolyphosphatase / guanosine-5'-triphosphate,3'-diphosphate pyrophosphatase